ncbi:putative oxidoreductase [Hyphodiscus hymeniophilus]|uniref:Oxidoreductase n=1 Tax=Hyphodiscus hymeniophilus TaxID=353542 RepID=A0A9P6VD49_9HELO|nr:putative oxidoreductase [Hyphodiscus hymeniophilus]
MAATKLKITDAAPLLNSVSIPRLGFGSYLSTTNQCTASCLESLKAEYRHIDTAQYYENEKEVGNAVKQSGIPRSEIFITTKVVEPKGSIEKSYESLLNSVRAIDGEDGYVDLFLIHNAAVGTGPRKELWLALERLYKEGKTKSIGVSNYGVGHIEEMKEYASVWPPHVNQLEVSSPPQFSKPKGIVVEAYCPLVRNQKAEDSTLTAIAKNHHVSGAQVLVRYSLQKDWVPLPKSDTPSRIVANADVYGFHLEKDEMDKLDALDQGKNGSICLAVSNSL